MKINNTVSPDKATLLLADYLKEKGVAISSLAEKTGISYGKLQRSLGDRKRALRTDEFLSICRFLNLDPLKFYRPFTVVLQQTHQQ